MKQVTLFRLFAILICTATMVGCNKSNTFTLKGELDNGANKTIYIEELTPEGPLFLDSIYLDSEGKFSYKYQMPYPSIYNVHVSPIDYIVLVPQEGERINLSGDYDSIQWDYSIQGSPESIRLLQLQQYTNDGILLLSDLVDELNHNDSLLATNLISQKEYDEAKEITDSIFLNTYGEQQDYMCNFIQTNLGSLSTLLALYKQFNNQPLINPRENFDYYELVLQGLEESQPENPHTIRFKNTVEHLRYQNK